MGFKRRGFQIIDVDTVTWKTWRHHLEDETRSRAAQTYSARLKLTFGGMNAGRGNGRQEDPKGENTRCTSRLGIFSH